MDKTTAEILEKVKKLMALGTSPSEAEAASALEKARMLLARHGLTIEDIKTETAEITRNLLLEKKRLRAWETDLIQVICRTTFTQALIVNGSGTGQVLIIGREINTLAARDLFDYLHLVILKLGRSHSGQVNHLDSFRRGIVHRIGERLNESGSNDEQDAGPWHGKNRQKNDTSGGIDPTGEDQKEKNAPLSDRQLMIQMKKNTEQENREYIEENFGKTTTKRTSRNVDSASYHKGRAAGDTISLNRQIQ